MGRRKLIDNDEELWAVIHKDITKAMSDLPEVLEKELHKSFHEVGVPVNPGGIGYAWDKEFNSGSILDVGLTYNQGLLSVEESSNPFWYRHASPVGSTFDNFADLIEFGLGGNLSCFGGADNPTRYPRPFWRTFINNMDNKLFNVIMPRQWKKAGISDISLTDWWW